MPDIEDYIKAFKRYLPERVFQKIIQDPKRVRVEGEKRFVTVLFGDLSGFTSLTEKLEDPEKIVEVVNRYFIRMLEIVEKYGGDVDKFLGDAIMVIFGAPIAHKDDPERAVRAALEMIQAIKELGIVHTPKGDVQINMSIGINTGEVVALNMGSDRRMEYTVMGDNVNLSSRLESVANAGEVIISDRTYRFVKDVIRCEKLKPVKVKGKEKPIQIYRALGVRERKEERKWVFVDREVEMERLRGMLRSVLEGNGRRVNIHAPFGTGKTSLILKTFSERTGYRFIHIEGNIHLKNIPLGAFKKTIKEMYGDNIPDELQLLYKDVEIKPEEVKARVFSFLDHLLNVSPQVIFLEDASTIDPLTLNLFREFPLNVPILLILESEEKMEGWDNFSLEPLDIHSIKLILSNIYGNIEEDIVKEVFKWTGGNPFIAESVFKLLREKRYIKRKEGTWRVSKSLKKFRMPESTLAVAVETLDRLPEELYEIVQLSSVIGSDITETLIEKIFNVSAERTGKLLQEGVDSGIFTFKEGKYNFSSPVLRDAAYSTLFKKRRKEIHNRVAEYLEEYYGEKAMENSYLLGYHYEMAGMYNKAIGYILRSAERARFIGDYRTSMEYYAKGLEMLRSLKSPEYVLEATTGLGKVYFLIGDINQARRMFRRAMLWARRIDLKKLAEILGLYSALFSTIGDMKHSEYYLKRAGKIYKEMGDEEGEARVITSMGTGYLQQGDFKRAMDYFEKALNISLKNSILDLAGTIYYNIGYINDATGRVDKARENYKKSLDIWKKLKQKNWESKVYLNLGVNAGRMGKFDEAIAHLEKAITICEETGDRDGLSRAKYNLGIIEMQRGRLERCLDLYRDAEKYFEEQGILDQLSIVKANTGEVWEKKGELKIAHEYYSDALDIARKIGNAPLGTYLLIKIGQLQYWWGRFSESLQSFQRAEELANKLGIKDFHLDALQFTARLYIDTGLIERAGDLLSQISPEDTGNPEVKGRILETMGIYAFNKGDYATCLTMGERLVKGGEMLNVPEMKASGLMLRIMSKTAMDEDISEEVGQLDTIMQRLNVPYIRLNLTGFMGDVYFKMGDFTSGFSILENGVKDCEEMNILFPSLPMLLKLSGAYMLIGKEEEAMERIEKAIEKCHFLMGNMNKEMMDAFLESDIVMDILQQGVDIHIFKGNIPLAVDFIKKIPSSLKEKALGFFREGDPNFYREIISAIE